MLRNIQKKIILMFLVIGVIIIGTIGYTNYTKVKKIQNEISGNDEKNISMIQEYKEELKKTTIAGIAIFTLVSVLIRYICN